ncbi:hypothetical protein JCM15548_14539 [Geofilum rubicundum JCM 15548]|uniref:Type II toxin-antitoxin system RelE/ParE family toxin n=2 Tax=Geofilum TaxID=1236988 RepID=A0A0E9LR20_9BACT|nr:hypothetical protein JCM15548_14539 [Geofilum rubicundum JCM 15548]
MDYKIRWSEEAVNNLEDILDDLRLKWTDKEIENFKKRLSHQISLIKQNPFLFPSSSIKKELRKAVLSKQTTVFYQIENSVVNLTYLHINKRDIKNIE